MEMVRALLSRRENGTPLFVVAKECWEVKSGWWFTDAARLVISKMSDERCECF